MIAARRPLPPAHFWRRVASSPAMTLDRCTACGVQRSAVPAPAAVALGLPPRRHTVWVVEGEVRDFEPPCRVGCSGCGAQFDADAVAGLARCPTCGEARA